MDIVLSLSLKMNEFVNLRDKIIQMGGNADDLTTTMEDITRLAVTGSSYQDRYYQQWGLYLIAISEQSKAVESLNSWSHSWHDIINESIKMNDAITCNHLDRIITGGLF